MHLLGTAAVGGLYAAVVEPRWLEIVRRPLPVCGLPAALAGRTLVQLSDIHVGPLIDDNYVLDVFARVAALDPDIVVLTGDFVSHFEQIERARGDACISACRTAASQPSACSATTTTAPDGAIPRLPIESPRS